MANPIRPFFGVLSQDEIDSLLGFDDDEIPSVIETELLERSEYANLLHVELGVQQKQYLKIIEELGEIGEVYHELMVYKSKIELVIKKFEDLKSDDKNVNDKLDQMTGIVAKNNEISKKYKSFCRLSYNDIENFFDLYPLKHDLMEMDIHYIKEKIRRLIQERKNEE